MNLKPKRNRVSFLLTKTFHFHRLFSCPIFVEKMVQCLKSNWEVRFLRYNSSGFYEEKLSFLGLSSGSFPFDENGKPSPEKCSEIISAAFKNGISFFFIPPGSESTVEKFFGERLFEKPRGDYFLAGGISVSSIAEGADAEEVFEKQLSALKNGYFDYYEIKIENNDFAYFAEHDVYGIFSRLKQKGKIRHLGFSFSGNEEDCENVVNDYVWDYARLDFNFYSWDFLGADRLYRELRKKGIPFLASDPYMGGMILDPTEEVLEILEKGDPEFSMKEWALRWFFDKKGLLCIFADPSDSNELEKTAEIISSPKTLNSSKRHCLKIAAQMLFEKNAEADPTSSEE